MHSASLSCGTHLKSGSERGYNHGKSRCYRQLQVKGELEQLVQGGARTRRTALTRGIALGLLFLSPFVVFILGFLETGLNGLPWFGLAALLGFCGVPWGYHALYAATVPLSRAQGPIDLNFGGLHSRYPNIHWQCVECLDEESKATVTVFQATFVDAADP
eukprot:s3116_g9.t1